MRFMQKVEQVRHTRDFISVVPVEDKSHIVINSSIHNGFTAAVVVGRDNWLDRGTILATEKVIMLAST